MKLYSLLLTGALTFGFSASAMADEAEGMVVAQAKTKVKHRAAKKAVTEKVAKKATKATKKAAAPLQEMAGEVQVEMGKKGAVKTVHLITGEGVTMPVMLNGQAQKMAKLGGKVNVKGTVITRKGVSWLKLVSFEQMPEVKPEPEVGEAPAPVEPVAAPASEAPMVEDNAPIDNAPVDDGADDAPMDDNGANDDGDN